MYFLQYVLINCSIYARNVFVILLQVTPSPTKAPPSEPADDTLSSDTSAWRRSGSLRTRTANRLEDTSVPANSLRQYF